MELAVGSNLGEGSPRLCFNNLAGTCATLAHGGVFLIFNPLTPLAPLIRGETFVRGTWEHAVQALLV